MRVARTWQRFEALKYAAGENGHSQGKAVMNGLEKLGLVICVEGSGNERDFWLITEKGRLLLTQWKNANNTSP